MPDVNPSAEMTNHTFKVITEQARPYQGFPYVNPTVHDVPTIPPIDPNQPAPTPAVTTQPGPSRPVHLELNQLETSANNRTKQISQAERELRQKYGPTSNRDERDLPHSRYIEQVTSPYVDETIFYDPFENRRIAHPKESPEAQKSPTATTPQSPEESSDESETGEACPPTSYRREPQPATPSQQEIPYSSREIPYSSQDIPYIAAGSSAISSGSSGIGSSIRSPMSSMPGMSYADMPSPSGQGSMYYTKESGVYGRTDPLPATIPVEQFPEPPPAYTERDEMSAGPRPTTPAPVMVQPTTTPPTPLPNVITTPTPTVGQDPTALYNPSRKYVTCQFCRQNVLTVIKKEANYLTHSLALLNCCCGMMPCAMCVYCMNCCKENRHYCPNCDLLIGKEGVTCDGIVYKETYYQDT